MALKSNSPTEQHPPGANILIVDDTLANLQFLHSVLVEQGYNVRVASSGQQAVASAQLSPPALILLDIKMPEMDGYQVCTQLKAHHRTRHIPVIFLSVLDHTFDKIKAFSVGGVDYITKPVQAEEVLARVKTHLALQAARQQLEEQNSQLARLNDELKQEIAERKQLASELEKHREHLEELVAARTTELHREIVERKRAEAELQENLQQTKIAYEQATIYAGELVEEVGKRKQAQAEREHLLELERKQRLQAEALRRTATALASTLNYEEVLDLILEQIEMIVSYDSANIMLVEGDAVRVLRRRSTLQSKAGTAAGPEADEAVFDIAQSPPLQTIYASRQPLLVPHVTPAPTWTVTAGIEWVKSYLGVPIQVRRQVVGFLNVSSAEPDFFKEADAERLQSLAYQAGTAIENARLFKSVSEQKEQLRALANRLTEVEEAERRQLARELHDQVGQNLTALSLNLKIVQNQLESQTGDPTGHAIEPLINRLADSLDLIEETTTRSRNVMDHLRPPALEEYGLLAALKWYVTGFHARTNIKVTLNEVEPEPRLPATIETVFFRIAQEALTNVARHARATQVEITLDALDDNVRMTIVDNGVGFDSSVPGHINEAERRHWGLLNMMERAYAVGGVCRVDSRPGEGVRVLVEIKR